MDNNIAERDVRLAVVGRKNFYGSGCDWSGQLAATMYSLLMTAQAVAAQCAHLAERLPASLCRQRQPRAAGHRPHFFPGPWTPTGLLPCAPVHAVFVTKRKASTRHEHLLRPRVRRRRRPGDQAPDGARPVPQAHAFVAQAVRAVRMDQTQRRAQGHDLPRGAAAHALRWADHVATFAHARRARPSRTSRPPPPPMRTPPLLQPVHELAP